MDFNNLDESLSPDNEDSCKRAEMFLLCNPHNPVGRVWKKQELQKLNQMIIDNDLILVSDEIHSDFIYEDNEHIPPASLSKEIEQRSITLMAPSKTFNIAGLHSSFAVIPNEKLRRKFLSVKDHLVGSGNIIGLIAMEAAYSKGEPWLEAQLDYLWDNIEYTINYIDKNMPKVKYSIPEGTYLLWLDFREYGNCSETINKRLVEKYSVALEPGNWFGEGGAGFLRMNIATQRENIKEALDGIRKMLKNYS
jgi:cystathionine beta-lyase